jgi:hypothetical protein
MGKWALPLLLALTVCVASFVRGAAGCTAADQRGLLAFKAQFDDPAGILKSWSPKDPIQPDCCGWKVRS